MAEIKRAAVILAGGSGTRFWPTSQGDHPKQYLPLFGKRTLIQQTWDRTAKICKPKDIFVCSSASQKKFLKAQIPKATPILEPAACNTGPAVLLSMLALVKQGYDLSTVVAVFPADHYIADSAAYERVLQSAFETAADSGGLVTLGIVPRSAHTGFGYIEGGLKTRTGALHVSRFVEKPDKATAESFLKSGKFFWNGGVFIWKLGAILKAFETLAPQDYALLVKAKSKAAVEKSYRQISRLPVDKMILEKSTEVYVVPAEMGWSDVGSWNTLYELKAHDSNHNHLSAGTTAIVDSKGCLVIAPGKTVSLIGIQDAIVVLEGDSLLVCARQRDQDVKKAVELLPKKK